MQEGTLNVLRAVANCPVAMRPRRVVLTSSLSSVAYGRSTAPDHVFTAEDWSDAESKDFGMGPYQRSKTLAERAAWDFVGSLAPERQFELISICPGSILGPLLGKQVSECLTVLFVWPFELLLREYRYVCGVNTDLFVSAFQGQHRRRMGLETSPG
jgi:nucleoside-diphosphate-sugar epimerase